MPPLTQRRAYVIGAYVPNGGTFMAYHLGRILEQEFGFQAIAVAVGDEHARLGIHEYDLHMPLVALEQMEREIGAADVLIVNPSFSQHMFGWRLPGFKISYVQGYNTYPVLDARLDHYVAVSGFVRAYLDAVYAIDARVIAPFINLDRMPAAVPWEQRPEYRVLPYRKGMPQVWDASFLRLRELIAQRAPHVVFDEPVASAGMPQQQLLAQFGRTRYVLALSAAEGFGLVPLEAMAMGAIALGYDGNGGREYMRSGDNCLVARYPQIERIAELLIEAVGDPQRGAALARAGTATASEYSYARFRKAWVDELRRVLPH